MSPWLPESERQDRIFGCWVLLLMTAMVFVMLLVDFWSKTP